MIEVKNLSKTFPGITALDDISFSVGKGEIVGFLGPNGAGKSTTMRILTCFLSPTRGSVSVAGFDALQRSMEVRRRVGYLPETNPLYPEMRVEEYLHFRSRIKKVPFRNRRARIDEVVERCGLKERRRSIIGHLSKGLKQRVGLADSIVHDPELIILDEPTIGLDPNQIREVRTLIRELGEKRTILLSTHILSEVEKMCGRVIILHAGSIVASGAPEEIVAKLTQTGRVRVEAKGDAEKIKAALGDLQGVTRVHLATREDTHTFLVESEDPRDLRPDIFRLAVDQEWNLLEVAFDRVGLEDAFAELTRQVPVGSPPARKTSFWRELFRG